jgi:ketosteroid isomerase-like protein
MSPEESRPESCRHRRFRGIRTTTAAIFLIGGTLAGCRIEVEDEEAGSLPGYVERMLEESAAAWNAGDLDEFMDDYVHSESITYIGGGVLLTGHDAIRAHYAPRFTPEAERDSLRFEDVRTRWLGGIDGLVTARWILYRDSEITASGPFTLVLRRTGSGWKIIHDHSSSDPPPTPPAN